MGLTYKSKAQCLPDNCSLVFTNMIDCIVELEIIYNCPPLFIDNVKTLTLVPGTRLSPSKLKLDTVWFAPPELCSCSDALIKSVKVKKIGGWVFIPSVTLLTITTFLYTNGTCCNVDLGYYSGCDVSLWMSCP